ncbi:transposable element Tc3 transposase [Trichonephila clavipes]|nr:transposable element Tc3 transposase [Trichonephila clavipes]
MFEDQRRCILRWHVVEVWRIDCQLRYCFHHLIKPPNLENPSVLPLVWLQSMMSIKYPSSHTNTKKWLVTLTTGPFGLGSNPGGGMDVCKCIVPLRHGGTLNSRRSASPLVSDEAHFWLNGYVNKQNCRIWSEANPQVYVETPLHPEKLTVWCALWAGGILLQNDEDHNVTVNDDRYTAMITNFFIPELNNHDVLELWFQQDGATCHTARATIDLLKDTFGDRLISRFGPVNCPPRSFDLTPLDYFL